MLTLAVIAAVLSLASGGLGVAAFHASSPPARGPKRRRPRHSARRNPYAAPNPTVLIGGQSR